MVLPIPPLRWRPCSLYRRPGPHPCGLRSGRVPTWRRNGGAGCTAAGLPMDSVHGRKACLRGRAAAVFAERPAGTAETVGAPTVTSPLERCAGHLLYHQRGKPCWRRRGHSALLNPFITRTATAAPSSPRADARVTLRLLQRPCALCSGCFVAKYLHRALEALWRELCFKLG